MDSSTTAMCLTNALSATMSSHSAVIWRITMMCVCVCLQVGPTSPPAPLLPPQPSIIHGGCQTSRTRPQIFCLPPKTWDEYVFFLPEIFARFVRLSFLQVLVEYSWMKYGSWESDGLLHIFGWFPNWWKVRQRVWEERDGWCGPGAGLERQQLDLRDDSEPARDAALYHLLLIPLQCVWEKVEYLQSWKHTTLILDHSPVHCVPLRLVFGKTRWISAKV